MALDPDKSTSRNAPVGRAKAKTITIYQIVGFVLPWNTAYKASRVLNTLFALELGATPLQTSRPRQKLSATGGKGGAAASVAASQR